MVLLCKAARPNTRIATAACREHFYLDNLHSRWAGERDFFSCKARDVRKSAFAFSKHCRPGGQVPQVLNVGIYHAIGRVGVYYGFKLGTIMATMHASVWLAGMFSLEVLDESDWSFMHTSAILTS
jgi:hypothetical protein